MARVREGETCFSERFAHTDYEKRRRYRRHLITCSVQDRHVFFFDAQTSLLPKVLAGARAVFFASKLVTGSPSRSAHCTGRPLASSRLQIPQDDAAAYMWFTLAAIRLRSLEEATPELLSLKALVTSNLDGLAKRMTPDQIAEAQRMAREWMAKHQQ